MCVQCTSRMTPGFMGLCALSAEATLKIESLHFDFQGSRNGMARQLPPTHDPSIQPPPRNLHRSPVFLGLARDELHERLRCVGAEIGAVARELLPHVGKLKYFAQLRAELVYDCSRRARRREQADPGGRIERHA